MEEIGYRFVALEKSALEPYPLRVRSRLGEAVWEEVHGHGRAMRLWSTPSRKKKNPLLLTPPEQHHHPGGLTTREVEVLGLVAEGLTNVEVAKRLFVSPRTVDTHLTSIYYKLGVSSRAVRFAIDHGLA